MNTPTDSSRDRRSGTGWPVRLAAAGLAVATPVAIWWLVGDQSENAATEELDYAVGPVVVDPAVERLVGIGSVLLLAAAVVVLVGASVWRWLDPRWWAVILPVVVAGMVAGFALRVLTAGVIGANIGAGLMLVFGGPTVAGLLLWAGLWSRYLVSRRANG
ncbi:MAG: hypothetical protein ACRDT2_06755 [Natronosporangium sp.]